jgi:hypothetical protein
MNIFKKSTFTWWQIGLFKLSLLTLGIAIGAYWQETFLPYLTALLVVAIVSGLYIAAVYAKQH